MISEPEWSKEIPSSIICTWFYAFALLNLFLGIAGVIGSIYLTTIGKYSFGSLIFTTFVTFIGIVNTWFFFLMCKRGIDEEGWIDENMRRRRRRRPATPRQPPPPAAKAARRRAQII
jgi:hypothetical protein